MSETTAGALLDLSGGEIVGDPYELYGKLREENPVVKVVLPGRGMRAWLVTRYADVRSALADPRLSKNATRMPELFAKHAPVGPPGGFAESLSAHMLNMDPPDHTRLRKLVSKAFVPKVVKALEPDINALVDSLLDKVEEQGSSDVIADLAHPLPVAVICRLLGVPIEDEPKFSSASALLAAALDPVSSFTGQAPDSFDEMVKAGQWLREYIRELIARRRSDPGDDLMSALIHVEESGDQLTEDEIVATCNLLLVAGHETTVNLIANAILAMLRHPRQWTALAADPQRVSAVVEETLRYDPPVQLMGRIAGDDMIIGDAAVPKGDVMMLLLAAAHHDAAAFDRPGEFDPDRENIRHLAFGKGPHFCLGAPLARLEAAVALSKVTARFPRAQMAGEPQYKPNLTLRGLASLEVQV
jgi:cytochrome P450